MPTVGYLYSSHHGAAPLLVLFDRVIGTSGEERRRDRDKSRGPQESTQGILNAANDCAEHAVESGERCRGFPEAL